MSSVIEKYADALGRIGSRVEAMETKIVEMGNAKAQTADILRKAMSSGGHGNYATAGIDGDPVTNLLRVGSIHQKAIGWGEYLQAVSGLGEWQDPAKQHAVMKKYKAQIVSKTGLAEGSGYTGGFTVPLEFYGQLLKLTAEEAFVRSLCKTIPMQSRTIQIPALDQSGTPATGTSAFFGGLTATWQPEAATYPQSQPNWRNIELVARDLVFTTVVSNQLIQDNAVALDTVLTSMFKDAMAWFYDYYILQGNGASQPMGVINAPGTYVQARGTSAHFNYVDAAQMLSRLLATSSKSACWVMHPSVMPELIQMTNGATASPFLLWMNPAPPTEGGPATQNLPMQLLGKGIYWTEKVPKLGTKGDVSLVDFGQQLVGDRLGIQIEASQYPLFQSNQMMYRIISRWDSQPWLNKPITLADGSYQMSSAVTLAT